MRRSTKELQMNEIVIDLTDPSELNDALKELAELPAGRKYFAECYTEDTYDADVAKIIDYAKVVYPGCDLTVAVLAGTLSLLMKAGKIRRRPDLQVAPLREPVEEVDTRPRDKNGRFLSAQEEEWITWCNNKNTPMYAINQNRKTDVAFAKFYNEQMLLRIAEEGKAQDGIEIPDTTVEKTQKLLDFQELVQKEPIENLKPKAGFVSINGEKIRYADFLELVDRCAAAGLAI